ncbi:MAG: Ig-like domain-containing protein [Myxococcota bacterium]
MTVPMMAMLGLGLPALAQAEGEASDDYARGTYVEVDASRALSPADTAAQLGGAAKILYLQRCEGGLTIRQGNGGSVQDESAIVEGIINLPPFPFGDAAWNDVVERTRTIFSPFNILVTDIDPSPMPHDEAVVCGDGPSAGFPGAGGVAPFSCGVIPNAITFTFPQTLGDDTQLIAEVIGQEAAHAWGLDHEFLCEDPMTYLSGCGPKTFQDIDAQCGEFNPRQCSCGGATQNSYQHILSTFGASAPDTQAPTAAITYPTDGSVFEPGAEFDITVNVGDDVQVADVTLFVDGTAEGSDGSAPFGPWPVSNIPEGIYEFYIEATDSAGKTTLSPVVTISVNANGTPPPSDPSADDDGGLDGSLDGGDNSDLGGGEGDGGAGAGALPPGYGSEFDPVANTAGCECTTRSSGSRGMGGGTSFGLILLGLWGLRARRRRAS